MHTKYKLFGTSKAAGLLVSAFRAAEAAGISTSTCTERGVGNFKELSKKTVILQESDLH